MMAVSSYKLETNDWLNMWKKGETNVQNMGFWKMWKHAFQKCEQMCQKKCRHVENKLTYVQYFA